MLPGSLTCNQCHKTIVAQYYEKDGTAYCPSCFLEKFQKVCISCENKIPIKDKYYEYKGNVIFCLKCNAAPRCFDCRLPVGNKPLDLKDGRQLCKYCQKKAVLTDKTLETISTSVQRCMTSMLNMSLSPGIQVTLVDLNQLREAHTQKNVVGYFTVTGSQKSIYVLSGLLPGTVVAVLAHELTHAWQYENNIKPGISDKDKEGFAEWVAYKVLSEFKYPAPRDAIKNNYYGKYREGFNKYLQMERKSGIQGVMQWLNSKALIGN
jgi:hypothetical protein